MRNRRYVLDVGNLKAQIVERTNCRLTAGAGAFHSDVEIFQTVFFRLNASAFRRHLRRKRGALSGATEPGATGGSPCQRIALAVGDGDYGVVKRGGDVSDPVGNVPFNALFCAACCCHFLVTQCSANLRDYFLIGRRGPLRVRALVFVR